MSTGELIQQLLQRVDLGERVAVCVVAKTRGSTPQKSGATMLVLESGQTLGTLGGGCVEAEARVRALRLLDDGAGRYWSSNSTATSVGTTAWRAVGRCRW
ncbi:MAG: XdhC family protein [Tepidisphaeraceae bacterium]